MSCGIPLRLRYLLILTILFGISVSAPAQGTAPSQNSATSQLTITATVVPEIYLKLSPSNGGGAVTNRANSSPASASALDLGNVNGTGTATPAAGVSVYVTDSSGALYTTPIALTPYFSGFTSTTATITVRQDLSSSLGGLAEVREGASPATATALSATTSNILTSAATSGSLITRYVGLFVRNMPHNSSLGGAVRARLIYEMTVP